MQCVMVAVGARTIEVGATRDSPRLRQSLAALGSDYGLNEEPKTNNGNSLRQPGLRASPRLGCSEMQRLLSLRLACAKA
jgi:hypothetical protein